MYIKRISELNSSLFKLYFLNANKALDNATKNSKVNKQQ